MKLTPCPETRTVTVVGIGFKDGHPIPIPQQKPDRCILPEHAGRHIWEFDQHQVGGYSISGRDVEEPR